VLPKPFSWNKGDLFLREGEEKWEGKDREGKAEEGREREGRGEERGEGVKETPCVSLNLFRMAYGEYRGLKHARVYAVELAMRFIQTHPRRRCCNSVIFD